MDKSPRIGMIGLGLMGLGIATNIVKKGFVLTAMEHAGNQPLGELIAAGAKTAATAQAVAQASDIVILVVNGSAQVEAILAGDTGLLAGLMGGLFSTAGPPLVYLLYRQPISQRVVHQSLFLLFAIGQVVRLAFIGVSGSFTWRSLLYIALSLPIVFLVQGLHRRFPLSLSPRLTTRLAAALLVVAGMGLVCSNWLARA